MDVQKRNLIIAVVLVGVFFFLLWTNVLSKRPHAASEVVAAPSETNFAGDVNIVQQIRQSEKRTEEEDTIWDSEWGKDPFGAMMLANGMPALSDLTVTGIVWDKANPLAVINGEVHTIGDTINGHTILNIRESSVVLSMGEGKYELPIFNPNQKRSEKK